MKHKVLFHVDESSKWKLALGNVKNLIEAAKGMYELEIELVANAEAVRGLTKTADPELIDNLHSLKDSLEIRACRNAMKAYEISEEDLLPFVGTVPAGVLELVLKQSAGYFYLKP